MDNFARHHAAPHYAAAGESMRMAFGPAVDIAALETTAQNPKHKREVCRYWLNSRCMKGQACEFLHAVDYAKMPTCTAGDACPGIGSTCNFKHPDPTRPVCANYQVGFCSFGNRCQYKHVVSEGPPPEVSAYWTREYEALKRELLMSDTPNWRKKPCDYFVANGWCPYFDMCNFKH